MLIELLGGLASALLLIAAAFVTSYRAAWVLVGATPCVLRWTATLVVGCWVATVGFHGLLAAGLFLAWPATAAALVLAIASERYVGARPTRALLARDARLLRELGGHLSQRLRSPWTWALLAFVPFVAARVLRALFQPPLGWDTLVYHAPRAALFVQSGAFTFDPAPGSWSLYRNVFAGGEVLWAWALLPFENDVFFGLAGAVAWLGVGVATWALARALRIGEPYASLAGALALFVPPTLQVEVPSGYVEPPVCLAVMAALATAVHGLRCRRPGLVVVVAMAAGVAAGIKPPVAVPAVIACVFLLAARRGLVSLFALLALGLPALPWAVHAWIDTGAPLSPMPLSLFGVTLGQADPHLRAHLAGDVSAAYTWAREWQVLTEIFARPGRAVEALGLLSALPLLLAPLGIVRVFRRSAPTGMLLTLALLSICCVLYLPGFTKSRLDQSANVSRFVIPAVSMGIPLSFAAVTGLPRLARGLAVLLWLSGAFYAVSFARYGWGPHEGRQLAIGAAAVLGLGLVARGVLPRLRRGARVPLALALVGAALVGLRHEQLRHRYGSAWTSFQVHPTPVYWAKGARLLDEPEEPKRIAVTAGPSIRAAYWFSYLFFGSELQNSVHYVPITTNGEVAHFGADGERRRLADRRAWTRRLREREITHVVSFAPASVELEWMHATPARFVLVHGKDDWGSFACFPARGRTVRIAACRLVRSKPRGSLSS